MPDGEVDDDGGLATIGDHRFFALLSEMAEMHSVKAFSYGIHDAEDEGFIDDPLAAPRYSSPDFGIDSWVYALMRANENMRRLQAQAITNHPRKNAMRDCFIDLASHALVALILWEEDQGMPEDAIDGWDDEDNDD